MGAPNAISHFDGNGTRPSGPSSGNVGVTGKYGRPSSRAAVLALPIIGKISSAPTIAHGTIGTPVRSAALTKPPRPKRCRVYRSLNGLPMPLNPSGKTPTSSPAASSRSASSLQARVVPSLRASAPMKGTWKTRSAPSSRSRRDAGWWSCSATVAISESTGRVPEWLATTSAPPLAGTFSSPWVSTRNQRSNHGRSIGSSTWSARSGSKPNSSVSYSPVIRRRRNSSPPASCSSQDGSCWGGGGESSSGRSGMIRASGIAHRPQSRHRGRGTVPVADDRAHGGDPTGRPAQHGPRRGGGAVDEVGPQHRRERARVVGQRLVGAVARDVPELLAEHRGVHDPAEVQQPHLLR